MPSDLSLRSPKVIIGGVLLIILAAACAAGSDDDDDCDSMGPVVLAAGTSLRTNPPAPMTEALPETGGFGTHLASCGG